jgi:hypothetical protein
LRLGAKVSEDFVFSLTSGWSLKLFMVGFITLDLEDIVK